MSTSEVIPHPAQPVPAPAQWTMSREEVDLVKDMYFKGGSDLEFRHFIQVCNRKQLDPMARQIYAVQRWDQMLKKNVMSFQTAIDGFRLIADRTGRYQGQDGPYWCGADGKWVDVWLDRKNPPVAAKVGVIKHGFAKPLYAVALYSEYVQLTREGEVNSIWRKRPAGQLAKCFSADTHVLTTNGFERFDSVTGKILQVNNDGTLDVTDSIPFSQDYDGPMVAVHGDMLDFAVTPNHSMVTTVGRVDASAMFNTATATHQSRWWIPMALDGSPPDTGILSDDQLRSVGYIAADGTSNRHGKFYVSVSRPDKIDELNRICSEEEPVLVPSRGAVAHSARTARQIRTNFDKLKFSFTQSDYPLLDQNKCFDVKQLLRMSRRECRLILDAWQRFDGTTNKQTGVRRIYSSRLDHVGTIELLAVLAGYTINQPKIRMSDISSKPNFCLTLSDLQISSVRKPLDRRPGLILENNPSGVVWCVTVPSGKIVVRRNGFSMICGNCAESLALRQAFPEELSGLYTGEEMGSADNSPEPPPPTTTTTTTARAAIAAGPQDDDRVPDAVLLMWSRITSIKGTCEVFADLKTWLKELGGEAGEKEYYRILKEYGNVDHANQFKSTKPAKICARKMWEAVQQAEMLKPEQAPDAPLQREAQP